MQLQKTGPRDFPATINDIPGQLHCVMPEARLHFFLFCEFCQVPLILFLYNPLFMALDFRNVLTIMSIDSFAHHPLNKE